MKLSARHVPDWMVRQGSDLVLVTELPGHRRLETTRRYSPPSDVDRLLRSTIFSSTTHPPAMPTRLLSGAELERLEGMAGGDRRAGSPATSVSMLRISGSSAGGTARPELRVEVQVWELRWLGVVPDDRAAGSDRRLAGVLEVDRADGTSPRRREFDALLMPSRHFRRIRIPARTTPFSGTFNSRGDRI